MPYGSVDVIGDEGGKESILMELKPFWKNGSFLCNRRTFYLKIPAALFGDHLGVGELVRWSVSAVDDGSVILAAPASSSGGGGGGGIASAAGLCAAAFTRLKLSCTYCISGGGGVSSDWPAWKMKRAQRPNSKKYASLFTMELRLWVASIACRSKWSSFPACCAPPQRQMPMHS